MSVKVAANTSYFIQPMALLFGFFPVICWFLPDPACAYRICIETQGVAQIELEFPAWPFSHQQQQQLHGVRLKLSKGKILLRLNPCTSDCIKWFYFIWQDIQVLIVKIESVSWVNLFISTQKICSVWNRKSFQDNMKCSYLSRGYHKFLKFMLSQESQA